VVERSIHIRKVVGSIPTGRTKMNKNTAVLYHGDCHDGFGGAFAVWKKFGDNAEYIPVKHATPPPAGLEGREIYIIDFSYAKDVLQDLNQKAKSLTVLDHHITAKEAVTALPNHVFDLDHSGCYLAWRYFHPDKPVPRLVLYLEQGDLWKFDLPHTLEVKTYIYSQNMDFKLYEHLLNEMENDQKFEEFVQKGKALIEYRTTLLKIMANNAYEVEFEGYRVLAVNTASEFRSDLGNLLAKMKPPFGIVWYYRKDGKISCSMRGDGSIDLTQIAQKYGGGGHHSAASFTVPIDLPLPFKQVK
jgi:oligoribonuclease NrnB/cAMP/cGMP phosphodiesterase (DHH superfamily)